MAYASASFTFDVDRVTTIASVRPGADDAAGSPQKDEVGIMLLSREQSVSISFKNVAVLQATLDRLQADLKEALAKQASLQPVLA